ncbi:phytoene desaturase family protein [Brumimicrobium aurantiacum]|uniref:phytoene desaturase family protein n=1 Tax=Brumimicrobium aurantiacum TaxID=1737063 RepID=UPI001F0BA9FF|nr:NAD(P)/FAD-dependent oxidoreductase [Brumimicrobium aurantiacum]
MGIKTYDAVVIGSGVGGLSTAIALGENGYNVLVIEQHEVPGGWSHSFSLNSHRFSPGVHYVGQLDEGQTTNEMYKKLGIANDLVFFRMNPKGFEHCILGSERFDIPAGLENIISAFQNRFPKEHKAIDKYVRLVARVNYQIQLMSTFKTFFEKLTAPFKTKHVGKFGLFSLERVIGWHLKDSLLKSFLNIQCGDHGLPPKKAPFPVHSSVMGHYMNGGFYPHGGGGGLVKSMTKAVKKHGGEIILSTKVKKILLNDANEAIGVETEKGDVFKSNCIISNTDPHNTYKKLVGEQFLSKKLLKKLNGTKYSVTSFILFLTLKIDLSNSPLDSGNYWIMEDEDLNQHFSELTSEDVTKGDKFSAVFMSCTTLKDPPSFNGVHHNFEVVTYVNYDCVEHFAHLKDYKTEEYRSFKEKVKNKLINNVEELIPEVKDCIAFAELGTPLTNEYYINSTDGNVYGTEKTLRNIGPLAFKNKSEIKNLYLAGASTLSHGVSGATSSGINAAANILNVHPDEVLTSKADQKLRVYDADDESTWPDWVHVKRQTKAKKVKDKV